MRYEYTEATLKEILKYYADGFKLKPGEMLVNYEPFVDVAQGKVIFRLVVDKQEGECE